LGKGDLEERGRVNRYEPDPNERKIVNKGKKPTGWVFIFMVKPILSQVQPFHNGRKGFCPDRTGNIPQIVGLWLCTQ